MAYQVIHMIEAADWLDESEYSRLVEQCGKIFRFLDENERCSGQVCMIFSDKVKEIRTENSHWPGESAFRRPRRKKKTEKTRQGVCFEDVLHASASYMQDSGEWVVILYTAGAVRRSKKTLLAKWKKSLPVQPILLAVKTEQADRSFLESYSAAENRFDVGMTEEVCIRLKEREIVSQKGKGETGQGARNESSEQEELWKIIRDCFE